ncbi:MAG: excinuclease ABC subunit UvrA [Fuerstiella sp.]|nr:excinuclease ABC subunit UvrA [Fuerstiella sp.]MCP4856416.1 excinuclease ABC subunit UvrA [Fuerstiella sp.]
MSLSSDNHHATSSQDHASCPTDREFSPASSEGLHRSIELEGVRVHNLRDFDLKIRRNALTVICGVSGSGKSSLAFDTLFAEGQRRYVETFSPYARQFLDRVERPDVDRIDGIPPAIAIRQNVRTQSARSTVGTRTEILDYLRVLFAKAGQVVCPACNVAAITMSADSASDHLMTVADGRRCMLVFDVEATTAADLLQDGFTRCVVDGATTSLEELDNRGVDVASIRVVADRLRVADSTKARVAESIEQAFAHSGGRCIALLEAADHPDEPVVERTEVVDQKPWQAVVLSQGLTCTSCGREFAEPSAESMSFHSALGACTECEGFGQVSDMTLQKVVPDSSISLRDGAIQPWTTPAYRHELDELLALAPDYGIPIDVPFSEVGPEARRCIEHGVPEREFGGLSGFHRWLVRNRYKRGVSVLLNRWRSWLPCSACNGTRLSESGRCLQLGGATITDVCQKELGQLNDWLSVVTASLAEDVLAAMSTSLRQLTDRLRFLNDCGLSYVSLDRTMKTLSGGEAQRVVLTAALGSGLINTLYVLDEPTSGLHSTDTQKVIDAARRLQQLGNTVVVVEHDSDFIRAADELIEIGPEAGNAGGMVVFQGTPAELQSSRTTATSESLADLNTKPSNVQVRQPQSCLKFSGVTCHNVHSLSGTLPLGVICAVTGISGSGKSSLVVDAVYPALCRRLGQSCDAARDVTVVDLDGWQNLSEVSLLDQSPLPRSRRSIPATTIGCFGEIRKVMALTHESRKRNYKPGMFSFNSAQGGRCENCDGHGVITVEMQFLADIQTTCEQCSGRRFRPDVLDVRYRDRSIHDILEMTGDEAFVFFNGHRKIQQRLNALRQAGLGYIRLGQPVSTLSGGECQRLRIAALLAGVPQDDSDPAFSSRAKARKSASGQTLFILDEPSTGLHPKDIAALMRCLNHLVEIGHSIIVIEHDPQVIRYADHVIEMGPGAGHHGGQIISAGPLAESKRTKN